MNFSLILQVIKIYSVDGSGNHIFKSNSFLNNTEIILFSFNITSNLPALKRSNVFLSSKKYFSFKIRFKIFQVENSSHVSSNNSFTQLLLKQMQNSISCYDFSASAIYSNRIARVVKVNKEYVLSDIIIYLDFFLARINIFTWHYFKTNILVLLVKFIFSKAGKNNSY